MAIGSLDGRCCCRRVSYVKDLKRKIVGNSANQRGMQRVMLNIVHNGGMMSVNSGSMKCFIIRCKFGGVPLYVSDFQIIKE